MFTFQLKNKSLIRHPSGWQIYLYMTEFEFEFVNECKRLGFRKSDVAEGLGVSQPTLHSRLKDATTFKRSELSKMIDLGFQMPAIDKEIKRRLENYLKLAK